MRGLQFYILIAMSLSSAALAQPAASSASQPQQVAPATPGAGAKAPKQYDTQRQCVDDDKQFRDELKSEIRPVGETIVIDSNFLPTKQHVDIGVRAKYVEGTRYFSGIDREDGKKFLLHRQDVLTRRATESDTLVKKHLLEADETIVTLTIATGEEYVLVPNLDKDVLLQVVTDRMRYGLGLGRRDKEELWRAVRDQNG